MCYELRAASYESQADAESEVTFADMLAGGVLHDMDMTGRPGRRPGARQSPVAGRTRSKAPVPAAKVKAVEPAVLQEDDEEEEEEDEDEETALDGATEAGGGDDDVFTIVQLSTNRPAFNARGRVAGGGTIQNGRWVADKDPKDGRGPVRRI